MKPPVTVNVEQRDTPSIGMIVVLSLAGLAFSCGTTVADPDLWGHTLYGLRAAERGVLAEPTDPFSYTALGNVWINHEWLTEYQYGWLWKNCGGLGLWMWRNVAASVVFGFCALAIRKSQANLGAAILILVFGAEALSTYFVFIRPQLATLALFAVTLFLLRRHWDRPALKLIIGLPIVMGLWVNLHGGFLAGLALMGLFLVAWGVRAIQDRTARRPFVQLTILCLLAALATLVNPYGHTMLVMLWDHLLPEQAVNEWQPLWAANQLIIYYIPFVLLGISLFGWRRWSWIDGWVLAFVTFAALRHIRHGALLTTALLMLVSGPLSCALRNLFPRIAAHFNDRFSARHQWLAVVATVAIMFAIHLPGTMEFCRAGVYPWNIAVETSRSPPGVPLRAITLIRDEAIEGNMVTDYAWGQYVLWHLFPKTRVAFDGRYRTVYPVALERQFLAFIKADVGDSNRFAILDDYDSEIVLLPSQAPASQQTFNRVGWVRILHDEQASLFVRDVPKFQAVIQRYRRDQFRLPQVPKWSLFPAGPTSSHQGYSNDFSEFANDQNYINAK